MPDDHGAELLAAYLLERTREHGRGRAFQGLRTPAIPCRSACATVNRFATERFYRVPELAVRALVAWAEGKPVELLGYVPNARHVLELQARGARCVSALPESAETAPHASRFDFVLHDLCHLGKFVCSVHYAEQVGFFATLRDALRTSAWRRLDAALDEEFRHDCDHVSADMNGSSVFLFAVLKMKLKMAARRLLARERRAAAPTAGPLSKAELAVFHELFERVLEAFRFDERLRMAAKQTSAKHDAPEMAVLLEDHFRAAGRVILSERAAYTISSDAGPD